MNTNRIGVVAIIAVSGAHSPLGENEAGLADARCLSDSRSFASIRGFVDCTNMA
jgi:hypothetical protein